MRRSQPCHGVRNSFAYKPSLLSAFAKKKNIGIRCPAKVNQESGILQFYVIIFLRLVMRQIWKAISHFVQWNKQLRKKRFNSKSWTGLQNVPAEYLQYLWKYGNEKCIRLWKSGFLCNEWVFAEMAFHRRIKKRQQLCKQIIRETWMLIL